MQTIIEGLLRGRGSRGQVESGSKLGYFVGLPAEDEDGAMQFPHLEDPQDAGDDVSAVSDLLPSLALLHPGVCSPLVDQLVDRLLLFNSFRIGHYGIESE